MELHKYSYIPRRFRFPFLLLILETTFDGLGVPPENRYKTKSETIDPSSMTEWPRYNV